MQAITYIGHWLNDAMSFAANIPVTTMLCCDGTQSVAQAKAHGIDLYSLESHLPLRACWTSADINKLVEQFAPGLKAQLQHHAMMSYSSSAMLEEITKNNKQARHFNSNKLKQFFDNKIISKKIFKRLHLTTPHSQIIHFSAHTLSNALHNIQLPIVVRRIFSSIGAGTFIITHADTAYEQLLAQGLTPNEPLILEDYVKGIPINMNAVIMADSIHVYEPSIQLLGIPELTSLPFGFCGNDYISAQKLSLPMLESCTQHTQRIGDYLSRAGYKGVYGIDLIITENGVVMPCEINPRFQSSTSLLNWTYKNTAHSPAALHMAAFGYENIAHIQPSKSLTHFSQLIFHTLPHETEGIITHNLMHGRYRLSNDGELSFMEATWDPTSLQSDEILISSLPTTKSRIAKEAVLMKVIVPYAITEDGFSLNDRTLNTLLGKLKSHLRIEPFTLTT